MHKSTLQRLILAGAISALLGAAASAQNPNFTPGDLILGFQNVGGTQNADKVVLLSLGDTAFVFRDATSNLINMADIGSLLTSTYGANWWQANTLYMSIVGVWGNNALSNTLQHGDPHRTVYIGKERSAIGIEGVAGSAAPGVANATEMSSAANGGVQIGTNDLETLMTASGVFAVADTAYDNLNPFTTAPTPSTPGLQGNAYTVFSGGVQDGFEAGSFGTFGGVSVEAALDLYRLQAKNNIAGQYGQSGALNTGEFQGTVVIDQAGKVSFIVTPVPEPSAFLLLGLTACGFASRLRRRTAS